MDRKLDPLEEMAARAEADRQAKKGRRKADQVLAEDQTLRTFSARLTAKEIVRLRTLARAQGVTASELLRRLLNEGLDRIETRQRQQVDPKSAVAAVEAIVKVLDASGIRLESASSDSAELSA